VYVIEIALLLVTLVATLPLLRKLGQRADEKRSASQAAGQGLAVGSADVATRQPSG
jgi:hypothetical protein